MKIPKKAFRLSRRLKRVTKKMKRYDANGNTRDLFIELKIKQVKINNDLNKLLLPLIELESETFRQVAHDNYSLLDASKFEFFVTEDGMDPTGSFVKMLEGSIHSNGYAYCEASQVNFPFYFDKFLYPKVLMGYIDCIGNIMLKTVVTYSKFLTKFPTTFESQIGSFGKIKLVASELETDLLNSGSIYVSKIMGYPFKSENDQELFLSNRNKLIEILEDFRKANGLFVIKDMENQ